MRGLPLLNLFCSFVYLLLNDCLDCKEVLKSCFLLAVEKYSPFDAGERNQHFPQHKAECEGSHQCKVDNLFEQINKSLTFECELVEILRKKGVSNSLSGDFEAALSDLQRLVRNNLTDHAIDEFHDGGMNRFEEFIVHRVR